MSFHGQSRALAQFIEYLRILFIVTHTREEFFIFGILICKLYVLLLWNFKYRNVDLSFSKSLVYIIITR
jgi:hypothetical protein